MGKFKEGDRIIIKAAESGEFYNNGDLATVQETGSQYPWVIFDHHPERGHYSIYQDEADFLNGENVGASVERTTKAEYLVFLDQTFDGMKKLIQAKQSDYTSNSDDPFANFRSSDEFGVDPLLGVFLRMSDKFQRIKSFSKAGKLEVAGEGVDDALKDIMGYSLIALALLKEKSDGNKG